MTEQNPFWQGFNFTTSKKYCPKCGECPDNKKSGISKGYPIIEEIPDGMNQYILKCEKCNCEIYSDDLLNRNDAINIVRTKLIDKILC